MIGKLQDLPVSKLSVSEYNVRKAGTYQDIDELARNIAKIGVQNPLIVTKHKDGKFEVVAGQRRYIAAKKAGLETVPCIVKKYEASIDCIVESFSENIFRSDMTLTDKANATKKLMKHFKDDKHCVAETIGVATVTVDKYLEVYSLPKILQRAVRDKKMNFETAKTIYRKTRYDKDQMNRLVSSYINKNSREKTDYYAAIKASKDLDSIEEVFKKIQSTQKTELRLPTPQTEFVKKIAKEKNMTPEMVLLNLLVVGINEYRRGRVRF